MISISRNLIIYELPNDFNCDSRVYLPFLNKDIYRDMENSIGSLLAVLLKKNTPFMKTNPVCWGSMLTAVKSRKCVKTYDTRCHKKGA